jgi:hypothetical protein
MYRGTWKIENGKLVKRKTIKIQKGPKNKMKNDNFENEVSKNKAMIGK